MAIIPYLAMTAAEIRNNSCLPTRIAWMACHFSPYSTGISNLPEALPEGSMLILNDITPIRSHDPELIASQLQSCMEENRCSGLLLDFLQKDAELAQLADCLAASLSFPVAGYGSRKGPLVIPPVPCDVPLSDYITPWNGREIWLEISPSPLLLQLNHDRCTTTPFPLQDIPAEGQKEETLHCHYQIRMTDTEAGFTLWRTKEDILDLLDEAEALGIHTAVGLWQELR